MRIRLLGELQVTVDDGKVLKFGAPAKAAALLAYLVIHRERIVARDTVAFALWPDAEEEKARANLRRHLALLVRTLPALDPPPILADQRSIHWNRTYDASVDVCEFERCSADPASTDLAVAAYGGDLLPESFEEWLLPERERLRSLQTANLERASRLLRGKGDYPNAVLAAKALLAHDPWREDTVRYLMSLRYESGDRTGALREFEQFAARLRAEMQVAPMPETIARRDAIARGETALTSDAPASAAPLAGSAPFVGRAIELARLSDCWGKAMRGHGRVAFVTGEAGIGKTRLCAEFGNLVESQGGRIAVGATTFAEAVPYQAILEAMRGALPMIAAMELRPMWAAAAATVLPELHQTHANLPRLATLGPEREQVRLFEALWRCLEGVARNRPLLLVLEDLHWAGRATIAFLEYVAARIADAPMVVLITYRDNEIDASHPLRAFRRAMQREDRTVGVPLEGLSAVDVARFLERNPGAPQGEAFSERARALSQGNPFFLCEIVRETIASGAAVPELPESLAQAIAGRVARLSERARATLDVAAVAGGAFTAELVAAAGGFPENDVLRAVDELLDARLVRLCARGSGDALYCDFAFSHDLVHVHAYASVPANARRTLHRRIATAIERLYADRGAPLARELALHFDRGGEAARAAASYATWARAAVAVHADEEALEALGRAVELCVEPSPLVEILASRESIYARRGMRAEQRADMERLEALADASDESEWRLQCARRRVQYARAVDDLPGQEAAIDALRVLIGGSPDGFWGAFCRENAAAVSRALGRYDRALAEAESALAGYEAIDDAGGSVRALWLIADVYGLQAKPARSREAIEKALLLAEASSNEALMIGALDSAARSAYRANDYDGCEALARRGLALARAIGDREGEADARFHLGNVFGRRFAVDVATGHFVAASDLYDAANKPLGKAMVLVNRGVLALKVGEFREAVRAFARSRTIFHRLRDLRGRTISTINLGMAAYCLERFEVAKRISRAALVLATELGTPAIVCAALSNLGASERELGDVAGALVHCEESMRLRREKASVDIASDLADLGLTYLRAEDHAAAVEIAREIVGLDAASVESVMFPQDVMWSAARIFTAAGETDASDAALARASSLRHDRIEAIPEGRTRETYRALRCNREILAASSGESDGVRTVAAHTGGRE